MLTEIPQTDFDLLCEDERSSPRTMVVNPLPPSMVMTEAATAALRAELSGRGSGNWIIFYNAHHDLFDLENHLTDLKESARWEPLAGLAGGESVDSVTFGDWGAKRWPAGLLYLESRGVALARWYWADVENGKRRSLYLVATESTEHFRKLRSELATFRRGSGEPVWQIIHGGYDDPETLPRKIDGPEMLLTDALRHRIDTDVVRFFSDEVVALYRSLGVPHRRGLLMYGPPGNGKTSAIRRIGAMVPDVPALVLRASASFDSDDLEAVVKRWTALAPAILVIEDLDWLLKAVNVSTFLNSLDGISTSAQGLLLIATTNHPDRLDPAINNRPGRFDVTIEMPSPDRPLRERFFASRLTELPDAAALAADLTEGLSFAHLQEVLRLSGLLAINAGLKARSVDHLRQAAEIVQTSNRAAQNGFPIPLDVPFGLVRRKTALKV